MTKKINLEEEYKKIDNPVITFVNNGDMPHVELTDITRNPYVLLVPIGDVHLGSEGCNIKMFKDYIEFVKNTPHAYALFMGDIFDVATLSSPTSPFEQKGSLTDYENLFIDLVMPIKNKVIGIISGNHEDRLRKHANLDILDTLAHALGIPYCKDSLCNIVIRTGIYERKDTQTKKVTSITPGTEYWITAHHTSGGGGRNLNLKNVENLREIVLDSDIYLGGHTHKNVHGIKSAFKGSASAGKRAFNKIDQHFIVTGSFLNYKGYPVRRAMAPSPVSVPIIYLGTKKNTKIINVYDSLKTYKAIVNRIGSIQNNNIVNNQIIDK